MTNDKSYGPSRSYEVIKLSEQINRYVLEGDDCARIELLNQVINGDELTEALIYLKSEITKDYKQKIEKKENSEIDELIGNLEEIIKGKEGTIINEIKERILDDYITIK